MELCPYTDFDKALRYYSERATHGNDDPTNPPYKPLYYPAKTEVPHVSRLMLRPARM